MQAGELSTAIFPPSKIFSISSLCLPILLNNPSTDGFVKALRRLDMVLVSFDFVRLSRFYHSKNSSFSRSSLRFKISYSMCCSRVLLSISSIANSNLPISYKSSLVRLKKLKISLKKSSKHGVSYLNRTYSSTHVIRFRKACCQ